MLEQRRDRKDYAEKETQVEKSGTQQRQPRMLLFAEDSCRSLVTRFYH